MIEFLIGLVVGFGLYAYGLSRISAEKFAAMFKHKKEREWRKSPVARYIDGDISEAELRKEWWVTPAPVTSEQSRPPSIPPPPRTAHEETNQAMRDLKQTLDNWRPPPLKPGMTWERREMQILRPGERIIEAPNVDIGKD